MCPGCGRVWTVLHVLWSAVYVFSGAAQLIAGIFFMISLPALHLSCNLWTGSWNIIMGIGGGMLACFGQLSPRRQEFLLYMAVSILIVNAVNVVLSEWGFYWADLSKLLTNHPYQTLINYACFATRVAAVVVIVISFLDSQLAFCSMQTTKKPDKKKLRGSHEQVSDIEYIIPRPKSSKPHSVYNAYSQSWVFETDNASCSNHTDSSPHLKVPQNGTPKQQKNNLQNGMLNDTTHLIDNPVVHIEEASDDSTSNSDRKLYYMKSFSRSTSPVVLSASSSQLSLNQNNPPIYECLEKLTEPTLYRSRLNTVLSNKEEDSHYQAPQPVMMKRVESISPHAEKVQYASLMKELQKAIVCKKEQSLTSPQSTSESVTTSDKTQSNSNSSRHESSRSEGGKSSDAEFSKELEAALQLIQDLESPNTIETPSDAKSSLDGKEARPLTIWRSSDASESEKTLSAVGSLAEITSPLNECQPELYTFKPPINNNNGKSASVVVHCCESQSTSGYSSPTHPSTTPNWSTTSSINGSNNDIGKTLSYSIQNNKSSTIITLYDNINNNLQLEPKNKTITLVKITGNDLKEDPPILNSCNNNNNYTSQMIDKNIDKTISRRSSIGTSTVWNVKSLLRKKKQNFPKLCPELEGAIIKSESLAYLTELELLARHQRNKEIQRQIEERVLQQLGVPRTESNC